MYFPWVLPPLLLTLQLNIQIPLCSLEVERGVMGSQNHIYKFFSTTVLSSLVSTYADSQLHVPVNQFSREQLLQERSFQHVQHVVLCDLVVT